MSTFSFKSSIKRGLPVIVEAEYYPGQQQTYWRPGIEPEIEIVEVRFYSGHVFNTELSDEDAERLQVEAFEYLRDEALSNAEDLADARKEMS